MPPPPRFTPLPSDRSVRDLEETLLARWREEKIVARALAVGADGSRPTYVFYDGPPTANGRPGIHHVLARTVKDLICRHRAMKGFYVPRKAGWDTHGLPVEIEVEKALGISGKQDIERVGIEAFNTKCRESVWKYREEWERLVERIAHWLDYERPYVTYTNEYIESEWWALKTLFDAGNLYRGHKILPYCTRCGTTLSSHEVAQGTPTSKIRPCMWHWISWAPWVWGTGVRPAGGSCSGRRHRGRWFRMRRWPFIRISLTWKFEKVWARVDAHSRRVARSSRARAGMG